MSECSLPGEKATWLVRYQDDMKLSYVQVHMYVDWMQPAPGEMVSDWMTL